MGARTHLRALAAMGATYVVALASWVVVALAARIRKHTVPNHIWGHIHDAKFRGLKSHLITSESHPRVTSGQNSEASHIRVSRPQSHPDKIQSLPGGHPTLGSRDRAGPRACGVQCNLHGCDSGCDLSM